MEWPAQGGLEVTLLSFHNNVQEGIFRKGFRVLYKGMAEEATFMREQDSTLWQFVAQFPHYGTSSLRQVSALFVLLPNVGTLLLLLHC